MRFNVTVDEFYSNEGIASFIDKMATFLNIDPSRIRVVNIKKGSTIVDFFVDPNDDNSTNSTNSTTLKSSQDTLDDLTLDLK